ncbi:MAG: cofactor-independent phosphoglycerate mutase [Nitrospirota bacterium]
MKYIILLGDGMAGYPLSELGGKTTLEYAKTPNMDRMARYGKIGLARTVPPGMPPGSDVANLSVLGYDPKKYYTGRAPLEAASMGVELGPDDVAFRCNLVTIRVMDRTDEGRKFCRRCFMEDFSAGHITTDEARPLVEQVDVRLGGENLNFYPGVSYRHLMVWRGGDDKVECVPPHDITGREIADKMPVGESSEFLIDLMRRSMEVLEGHEVNKTRVSQGLPAANSIWLWGQGKKPSLPSFREKYGIEGAMISAVDLMKGIGSILGFRVIDVPGATGYIDTDYEGKANAALAALEGSGLVYVHVEAPDEAGHGGNVEHKLRAIEDFDSKVVGTVMRELEGRKDCRVLVMPDHPTPVAIKSHVDDPVPFAVWEPWAEKDGGSGIEYTEKKAAGSRLFFDEGWKLMEYLIKGGY